MRIRLLCLSVAWAVAASPAHGLELPTTRTRVVFTGGLPFGNGTCDQDVIGTGTVQCSGPILSFQGQEVIGTYQIDAAGTTTPKTATTSLTCTASGEGGGTAEVDTTLLYYVGIEQIAPPPFAPDAIPVAFQATGSVTGSAGAEAEVSGRARTAVRSFLGTLGDPILHEVSDTSPGGSLDLAYDETGTVRFQLGEGPVVAEVELTARCACGSVALGDEDVSCTASADPVIGFDQAAFDALAGPQTFPLADYFAIRVPEPAAAPLGTIGALGGAAFARRRRRAPGRS